MSGRVMYLTRSWPRLSQTFIVNEILALERRGVDLEVYAMAPSGGGVRQPQVGRASSPALSLWCRSPERANASALAKRLSAWRSRQGTRRRQRPSCAPGT